MTGQPELPQDLDGRVVAQPGLRFLEAAVYIMGGLLVLMLMGLIGGIAWKITHRAETPLPNPLIELGLAAGSQVQTMQLDGDRLALNTGTEIIVIDVRKNTVLSRISLTAK